MYGPARFVLAAVFTICAANQALAQASAQAAPDPIVTAQNDAWYRNGDPVTFEGNIYYPAGPRTYFNRYEMVRSGFFRGVPLYTRTTIEPYSLVFVPIGGGLMQPYERRRAGDVAGTVGSSTPSFPVVIPSEQGAETTTLSPSLPQAAAPPTLVPRPAAAEPAVTVDPAAVPRPVATSGSTSPARPASARKHAVRPTGPNAVYIEYDRSRYFSSGRPVLFDTATFTRIGERLGLPVYTRAGDPHTIYVPVQRDADLLARYTRQNQRF
jgi:hypothetical protein